MWRGPPRRQTAGDDLSPQAGWRSGEAQTQLAFGGRGGASRLEWVSALRAARLVERPARARRASFNVTAERKAAVCNGNGDARKVGSG